MKKVLLTLTILSLFVLPLVVGAVSAPESQLLEFGQQAGLGTTKTLPGIIGSIINVGLGLLGVVAVVIVIAGGFIWMTAAGDTEKIGKAKSLIFGGIIGMAIILSAYAITQFVLSKLITETGATL